jgi:hypothetical protein
MLSSLAYHASDMIVKYLKFVLYNGVSDLATRRPLALNRHQSVKLSCYFPQFPNPNAIAMHTLSFENIPSLLYSSDPS